MTEEGWHQQRTYPRPPVSALALLPLRGPKRNPHQSIWAGLPFPGLVALGSFLLLTACGKPFLGISYQSVPAPGGGQGAAIVEVVACSPANRAGLRVGDLILEVNGQPVGGGANVRLLPPSLPAGAVVSLSVQRGDSLQEINVPTGSVPTESRKASRYLLGMSGFTDSLAGGVAVACVAPGGAASQAGFQPGDVITKVDNWGVSTFTVDTRLQLRSVGDQIEFAVRRGDEILGMEAVVPERFQLIEQLAIGDPVEQRTSRKRLVHKTEIPLKNCDGPGNQSTTETISYEVSREMSFEFDAELEVLGFVPGLIAEGRLAAHYKHKSSEKLSVSKSVTLDTPAWTSVLYEVHWYVHYTDGLIPVALNGKERNVPFSLGAGLTPEIVATNIPCAR